MSTRQREWNQFEAVILLEGYLDSLCGSISRKDAITRVSQDLRKMALNQGEGIDEIFRNEAGIEFQMHSMESAFNGHTVYKPATKLFTDIVEIYRKNHSDYNSLLETAKLMINGEKVFGEDEEISCKAEFKKYLSSLVPSTQLNEYFWRYDEIEKYCLEKGILKNPLFETTNLNSLKKVKETLEHDLSFRFAHSETNTKIIAAFYYYYTFIKEKASSKEKTSTLNSDENNSFVRTKEDERLSEKYPVIFRRIFRTLQDSALKGEGLTSDEICDMTQRIARVVEIEDILDNASWASHKGDHYWFSDAIVIHDIPLPEEANDPGGSTALLELISHHYKYGFPIDSIIDLMRLRNYADEEGILLSEDDHKLKEMLQKTGVVIGDRVYALSDRLIEEIGERLEKVFAAGVCVVFLQPFYDKNSEWLEEHYIASPDVLREILKLNHHEYYWGTNIVTPGEKKSEVEAIIEEIDRVSREDHVIHVDNLVEQMEYIPKEKISWTLSFSQEFIWIDEGEYFRAKYFVISEEEGKNILHFVSEECSEKGFCSIADIPLGDIPIINYELSPTAVSSAIFNKILKGQYNLKGKIITVDKSNIDILVLLESYCRCKQVCSVSEVREKAKELTGDIRRKESFTALYNTMIRVGVDKFVSDDQVAFDIDEIDKLLNKIIGDRFAPIRKVSNFALFPTCGFGWNYFVLESFCYRFSKKYRLEVFNYNDKNAGLIVATDIRLSYDEMLSEATAQASINLKPESVGEYLYDNGYTAMRYTEKRNYAYINSIITRAKNIRGER